MAHVREWGKEEQVMEVKTRSISTFVDEIGLHASACACVRVCDMSMLSPDMVAVASLLLSSSCAIMRGVCREGLVWALMSGCQAVDSS